MHLACMGFALQLLIGALGYAEINANPILRKLGLSGQQFPLFFP